LGKQNTWRKKKTNGNGDPEGTDFSHQHTPKGQSIRTFSISYTLFLVIQQTLQGDTPQCKPSGGKKHQKSGNLTIKIYNRWRADFWAPQKRN
jgi:hypothetical protein